MLLNFPVPIGPLKPLYHPETPTFRTQFPTWAWQVKTFLSNAGTPIFRTQFPTLIESVQTFLSSVDAQIC